MWIRYLEFFGIGLATASLVTLLGIGGGLIMIPVLIYFTDIGVKAATAISAVKIFFSSAFGTIFNWLQKTINFRYAVIFGLSSVISKFIGSYFTDAVPELWIKVIYLASVMLALVLLYVKRNDSRPGDLKAGAGKVPSRSDYLKIIPIAVVSGLIFGVLGVGGGFMYVPLLVLLFDLPLKVATSTSLMIILINAVPGVVGKVLSTEFDIYLGLAVAAGAIIGSKIGTMINMKISEKAIKIIFTILLVVIIARMGWDIYAGLA